MVIISITKRHLLEMPSAIEEIGIEIENPFGYDANDLPLDAICHTINSNIEDYISENFSEQP